MPRTRAGRCSLVAAAAGAIGEIPPASILRFRLPACLGRASQNAAPRFMSPILMISPTPAGVAIPAREAEPARRSSTCSRFGVAAGCGWRRPESTRSADSRSARSGAGDLHQGRHEMAHQTLQELRRRLRAVVARRNAGGRPREAPALARRGVGRAGAFFVHRSSRTAVTDRGGPGFARPGFGVAKQSRKRQPL